jgi:hypothetical protein
VLSKTDFNIIFITEFAYFLKVQKNRIMVLAPIKLPKTAWFNPILMGNGMTISVKDPINRFANDASCDIRTFSCFPMCRLQNECTFVVNSA